MCDLHLCFWSSLESYQRQEIFSFHDGWIKTKIHCTFHCSEVFTTSATTTFAYEAKHSISKSTQRFHFSKKFDVQVIPKTLSSVLSTMEAYNSTLTVHRVSDPNHTNLLEQHWEIFDLILSCTNQQFLPTFLLNQSDEITSKFNIRELGFPLCVVSQVFHFQELIVWCDKNYSNSTRWVIIEKLQIFIRIFDETFMKMLGLHSIGFPQQNTT